MASLYRVGMGVERDASSSPRPIPPPSSSLCQGEKGRMGLDDSMKRAGEEREREREREREEKNYSNLEERGRRLTVALHTYTHTHTSRVHVVLARQRHTIASSLSLPMYCSTVLHRSVPMQQYFLHNKYILQQYNISYSRPPPSLIKHVGHLE